MSPHSILDVWEVYREEMELLGHTASVSSFNNAESHGEIVITISKSVSDSAYRIVINESRVKVITGGLTGLHYAITTLLQILDLFQGRGINFPQ